MKNVLAKKKKRSTANQGGGLSKVFEVICSVTKVGTTVKIIIEYYHNSLALIIAKYRGIIGGSERVRI